MERARPLCGALPGSSIRWAKTGKRASRRHGAPGAGRRLAGKRERREKHALQPSHASLRSLDRLQSQAGAAKARPVPAFPGPRSKNRRNPMASLAIPSAGSTACSRKRQRGRPSPAAVLACMRPGQSAFGPLAGLSAGGGRRPRAPPALRPGRRQGLQAAIPRFRGLRPRRAPVARQRPIRRTKRAGRRIHVRRRSAPAARARGRATPGSQPAPPGARRRPGAAAPPMPAAPVPARRRAARIRRAGPLLRPRPFPRRLGPLPLAPLVPRRRPAPALRASRRRPRLRPALQLRAGLVQLRLQRLPPPRLLRQAPRIRRVPDVRALDLAQQAPGPAAQPPARRRPAAAKAAALAGFARSRAPSAPAVPTSGGLDSRATGSAREKAPPAASALRRRNARTASRPGRRPAARSGRPRPGRQAARAGASRMSRRHGGKPAAAASAGTAAPTQRPARPPGTRSSEPAPPPPGRNAPNRLPEPSRGCPEEADAVGRGRARQASASRMPGRRHNAHCGKSMSKPDRLPGPMARLAGRPERRLGRFRGSGPQPLTGVQARGLRCRAPRLAGSRPRRRTRVHERSERETVPGRPLPKRHPYPARRPPLPRARRPRKPPGRQPLAGPGLRGPRGSSSAASGHARVPGGRGGSAEGLSAAPASALRRSPRTAWAAARRSRPARGRPRRPAPLRRGRSRGAGSRRRPAARPGRLGAAAAGGRLECLRGPLGRRPAASRAAVVPRMRPLRAPPGRPGKAVPLERRARKACTGRRRPSDRLGGALGACPPARRLSTGRPRRRFAERCRRRAARWRAAPCARRPRSARRSPASDRRRTARRPRRTRRPGRRWAP